MNEYLFPPVKECLMGCLISKVYDDDDDDTIVSLSADLARV